MKLKRALLVSTVLLLQQAAIACDALAARRGNRSSGSGMSDRAGHSWHGGNSWYGGHRHYYGGASVLFGASFFAPLYPYPPLLPYYEPAAPIYFDEYPIAAPLEPGFWYYCHNAGTYYPGVAECPDGWEQVAPR